MAKTKISWADFTFNPWRGCTKISAGCVNCYAETFSHNNPEQFGIWGDNGTRVIAPGSYWRLAKKWNRDAIKNDDVYTIFCASLADVFEDRPELDAPRERLFTLITNTPNLQWLLLTKRPENVAKLIPEICRHEWPNNIMLGVSVENQEAIEKHFGVAADLDWASMPEVFVSCEPLLGPLDFSKALSGPPINWVIVGGESGEGCRPMEPDWVRGIRDTISNSTPFLFKQWGGVVKEDFGRELDGEIYHGIPDFRKRIYS